MCNLTHLLRYTPYVCLCMIYLHVCVQKHDQSVWILWNLYDLRENMELPLTLVITEELRKLMDCLCIKQVSLLWGTGLQKRTEDRRTWVYTLLGSALVICTKLPPFVTLLLNILKHSSFLNVHEVEGLNYITWPVVFVKFWHFLICMWECSILSNLSW